MWMFLSFYFLIIFVLTMDQMIIYNEKCLMVMMNPQFHTLWRWPPQMVRKLLFGCFFASGLFWHNDNITNEKNPMSANLHICYTGLIVFLTNKEKHL